MKQVVAFGLILLFVLLTCDFQAQCVMCRAVAEDASTQDGLVGAGINKAIIYLMGIPYILLGILAVVFFMRKRKTNVGQIPA